MKSIAKSGFYNWSVSDRKLKYISTSGTRIFVDDPACGSIYIYFSRKCWSNFTSCSHQKSMYAICNVTVNVTSNIHIYIWTLNKIIYIEMDRRRHSTIRTHILGENILTFRFVCCLKFRIVCISLSLTVIDKTQFLVGVL